MSYPVPVTGLVVSGNNFDSANLDELGALTTRPHG